MEISVNDKKKILEAYLKKAITKDDMKFLFEVGISVPPIQWKFKTEADEKRHQRKRDLVEIVLGRTFPKIVWVKSKHIEQ
ncbi:hypothetical protein [Cecembia calidifontis]|nr:hypothetical protein [Cecembia calidifontis]